MALQNCLAITDRISKWNNACKLECSLCDAAHEPFQHLLLQCSYSAEIRENLLQNINITRQIMHFEEECKIAKTKACRNSASSRVYIMLFIEVVHTIWSQRNNKIFLDMCVPIQKLIKEFIFKAACNCKENERKLLVQQSLFLLVCCLQCFLLQLVVLPFSHFLSWARVYLNTPFWFSLTILNCQNK